MTARARPYMQKSIDQLEVLFEKGQNDAALLRSLKTELGHRGTQRAIRLRARVDQALAALKATKAPSPRPAPAPPPAHKATPASTPTPQPAARPAPTRVSPRHEAPRPEAPSPVAQRPEPRPRSAIAPGERDAPGAILSAWTALEALSPQTYRRAEDLVGGDRRCVASLDDPMLPWVRGERSRQQRQLYYQIILGAVPMDRAEDDLMRAFGEDEAMRTRPGEKAAIAAIIVDREGRPLDEGGVAISSFAWALPRAVSGDLAGLSSWADVEEGLVSRLSELFRKSDREGRSEVVTADTIQSAFEYLKQDLGLPANLAEPPRHALRIYHYYRAKTPPEPILLNSFFLGDLARAKKRATEGALPRGLRQYLGVERPEAAIDLFTDRAMLECALAPGLTPAARWPTPGGHSLVTLQQAAVNLTRAELAQKDGIVAVNGPPGTGKTTLLRDLVVASVIDRATAMAAFAEPAAAFTPSGQKIGFGGGSFLHLYRIDPSLRGHELLVASSNNKAVENVSRELPALGAVAEDTPAYFSSISDFLHTGRAAAEAGEEDAPAERLETWGLIAAVLGNARNRAAFQQAFWWDEQWSFRLYLKAAKGDSVVQEIRDDAGKLIERRTPAVILAEKPPSPEEAARRWKKARRDFMALKKEVDSELAELEAVRKLCLQLPTKRAALARLEADLAETKAEYRASLERELNAHACRGEAEQRAAAAATALAAHFETRPGFFARLFRTARFQRWAEIYQPLIAKDKEARAVFERADEVHLSASTLRAAAERRAATAEQATAAARAAVAALAADIETHRARLGGRLVDHLYFAAGHDAMHLSAPWMPDGLHRKREALFAAAMALHRAFIDASAQRLSHNLGALMDMMSKGPPGDPEKRALLGDLWSTLFLIVPLISTTFASVERMLGALPPESLGWLLVDEAGQALPQAAIGAILRARRSIVVGDPLQIPPVVTLPERLTHAICDYFGVDEARWAAPTASTQTLADRAVRFQARFETGDGDRMVGMPLLVHRRCREPMFSISNDLAYAGKMVAGPVADRSPIGAILGTSRWIDVDGEAKNKYCPDEGEIVIAMLRELAAANLLQPDIFIVTPFRIVAQELRRRIEAEPGLLVQFGVEAWRWVNDRVGTIHTVQGREAEAVILVLGAPAATQGGARSWAGATPNIFNVAVSRAKQRLYVVGSHGAWSRVGHANALSNLPTERMAASPGIAPRMFID